MTSYLISTTSCSCFMFSSALGNKSNTYTGSRELNLVTGGKVHKFRGTLIPGYGVKGRH